MENLINFKEFDIKKYIKSNKKVSKDILNESSMSTIDIIRKNSENVDEFIDNVIQEFPHLDNGDREWLEELYFESDINESVTDNIIKGDEIKSNFNPEKESGNLFGFSQVKNSTIKKVGSFSSFTKMINTKTPKERSVLNAGQLVDNNVVSGYINRIEGNKVYVESLDNPGEIIEVSLNDALKTKKEEK